MTDPLELVYYPDPRLRTPAQPVKDITADLKEVARRMFKIMYDTHGIGLAGPQVGYPWRVVVANLSGEPKDEKVFVNPVILKWEGDLNEEEGCLSLPGISARIRRSQSVVVEAMDLSGQRETIHAEDLYARLFQHECDHLDGVLIIDKMTPADLRGYRSLLKELEEEFRNNVKRAPVEQSGQAL